MDTQPTQPTLATLDDVRLAIFRQHTQLAQLIDELEAHATAVLAGCGEDRTTTTGAKALKEALALLNTRFVRHLDYEEAQLASWLRATDPEQSLLGDHGDQRWRMKGLLHDRDVFGDPRTLARAVLAFIHQLRRDMVDEDAKLRAMH